MKTIPTLFAAILATSVFSTAAQAQQAITADRSAYTLTVKAPDGDSKQLLVPSGNLETNLKSFKDNLYVKSCLNQVIEPGTIESGVAVKVVKATATQMHVDVAVKVVNGFDEQIVQGCKVQLPRISAERSTLLLNVGGSVERVLGYEFSAQRVN